MAKNAQVSIILKMVDKASASMGKVSSATKRMSNNMKSAGASMNKVSLPLLAIGVAGVKMASDLDKSMRNIQAFGGQSEKQIQALSQTFKDMSTNAEFGTQSAQQLADAYWNIQSAGFGGAEGMEVLEVSAKAATAGLTTTQKASEGIMTVLNAYGMEAKEAARVSDQLFTVVKLGVITFEQLVPTLGKVVPLANAMGVEFQELGAAYVVMTKQGLNAAEAATQQKAVMTQLLAPSEALQAQIQGLGFASGQAMVDSLGFLGALDRLGDSVGNDATEMQRLFVNTRAVQGAIALTGENAEKAAIALQEMQKAGAAQEAFNTQMQSFSAQFSIFKNTLGVFLIDIGEQLLPVLMKGMQAVRDIAAAFRSLPGPVQQIIGAVTLFVAVLGPILTIGGSIMGVFSTLAGIFATVSGALTATAAAGAAATPAVASVGASSAGASVGIGALAASLWAALAPFAAVLAPIAAVGVALAGLVAFGPKILEFGKNVIDGLIRGIKDPIGAVAWGIGKLFGANVKKGTAEGINGTAQIVGQEVVKTGNFVSKFSARMRQELRSVADEADSVAAATGGGRRAPRRVMAKGKVHLMSIRRKKKKYNFGRTREQARAAFDTFGGFGGGAVGSGGGFADTGGSLMDRLQTALTGPNAQAGARQQILETLGLAAGAGMGGDITINIENLSVPAGTNEEQVNLILDEITKKLEKRGLSGRGIVS